MRTVIIAVLSLVVGTVFGLAASARPPEEATTCPPDTREALQHCEAELEVAKQFEQVFHDTFEAYNAAVEDESTNDHRTPNDG